MTNTKQQSSEQMTLSDLLNSMTTLENNDYTPEERQQIAGANSENGFGFDEWIPPDFARMLIGKDFDPTCKYKLMTMRDSTIVLKIDDSIPENEKPKLDSHGNVIRAHIMEYPLAEDTPEIQSYSDMMSGVNSFEQRRQAASDIVQRPEHKKSRFWYYFAAVMSVLILAWCAFMYLLLSVSNGVF
ncbi:MAG: hypothetical protein NC548_30760 [Lachnospiraceae bacterium]|nr:hypothetical protein [Lachnospiraceae bacterium]